jgi:AcrR family transcriptional regulator
LEVIVARPRAPTFDHQRASILQTAAQLFAAHGYASTSMSALAGARGMSKALLYHYYRDKQHILFDIADSYMDLLLEIVDEVDAQPLAPAEHLHALVARFMRTYQHAQPQHMVLVQDVKFLSAAKRLRVRAKERRVVDAFAAVIAALKPRFRSQELRVPLAMILFGMINWTFTWLRPRGKLTYDDMARIVSELFLTGVLPAREGLAIARGKPRNARKRAAYMTGNSTQGSAK